MLRFWVPREHLKDDVADHHVVNVPANEERVGFWGDQLEVDAAGRLLVARVRFARICRAQ
jgi:hypothetical protein